MDKIIKEESMENRDMTQIELDRWSADIFEKSERLYMYMLGDEQYLTLDKANNRELSTIEHHFAEVYAFIRTYAPLLDSSPEHPLKKYGSHYTGFCRNMKELIPLTMSILNRYNELFVERFGVGYACYFDMVIALTCAKMHLSNYDSQKIHES